MGRLLCLLALLCVGQLSWASKSTSSVPSLPSKWSVLGPFPRGNREFIGDPIESPLYGDDGIFSQRFNQSKHFWSELVQGGRLNWTTVVPASNGYVNIPFPNVRWDFITSPLGDIGASFQGWALGDFAVAEETTVLLQCAGVREVFLDSRSNHMFGDPYTVGRSYFPIHLSQGQHTLYVRLKGSAGTSFRCDFTAVEGDQALCTYPPQLCVLPDDITSDIVAGSIAAPYVSVVLVNVNETQTKLAKVTLDNPYFQVDDASLGAPVLAPGQPLPVTIKLKQIAPVPLSLQSVQLLLHFYGDSTTFPLVHNMTVWCRQWGQSYKFSFIDFDGSLQYSVLKPPNTTCPSTGCSILFTTHGAGVPADEKIDGAWAGAYQRQRQAWIVLPTGRRRFGFDWQGAGYFNARTALITFVENLPGVPAALRKNYTANMERILFGGHSMGGHGCWLYSTHFADYALGAAPAAGWIKSELYTPYFTRVGYEYIDAALRGLLESAIAEFDTDVHITNLKGIDVIARMGGDDTNVPPYHMRRMARLQNQQGGHAVISEIPGKPHWWGGVVDDSIMQAFYDSHLYTPKPPLPATFTLTCVNPAFCGSRGGFTILQLATVFRTGRVHVGTTSSTWTVATENVRRLTVDPLSDIPSPSKIVLDGQSFASAAFMYPAMLCRDGAFGQWSPCTSQQWRSEERNPATYGPFRTVMLRPSTVVYGTEGSTELTAAYQAEARWLAMSWYYQGRGVVQVMSDVEYVALTPSGDRNVLLFGGPSVNRATAALRNASSSLSHPWPLIFNADGGFSVGPRTYPKSAGLGVLSLLQHPYSPDAGLVGVVAGADVHGFANAAALFPFKSGMTVCDWMVAGPRTRERGVGGLLGAGFWNNEWSYDPVMSYLR